MDVGKAHSRLLAISALICLSGCGIDLFSAPNADLGLNQSSDTCEAQAIKGRYILRWKSGAISVAEGAGPQAALKAATETPGRENDSVDFVEPDYTLRIQESSVSTYDTTFDDPNVINTWGPAAAGAYDAWPIAKGANVIVAVVDSGVDVNHPQLRNQIAINTGEIPNNGIDDDKNGLIDDYKGYDFAAKNGNVHDAADSVHHGSHVSGIILAEHLANGSGVKGIAPQAKLLPLNFMSDSGSGYVSDVIAALHYAVQRGAKVINASWGSSDCSKLLQRTIGALESRGVLFVAAAGNGDNFRGFDIEVYPSYPAAYVIPGQITVGAMDSQGFMAGFSNYSRRLVHLLAPGVHIWSTVADKNSADGHGYGLMDGTSMATPFVSGAAAVLWSYRPQATVAQIKRALLESATKRNYAVSTGGALDLPKALARLAELVDSPTP